MEIQKYFITSKLVTKLPFWFRAYMGKKSITILNVKVVEKDEDIGTAEKILKKISNKNISVISNL
jgi:hypothetical protein